MWIAADAVGALLWEALAGAPFSSLDRLPHPRLRKEAELPGQHGGDPLPLSFHHGEQPARRVDEAGEEQSLGLRRNDPPIQRQLATVSRHERGGQEGEADPIAGGVEDVVDTLL